MRIVDLDGLGRRLAGLPGMPRVVVAGNAATPWPAVDALVRALPTYRLWILNAGPGVPVRAGVVAETPFVGPGMRGHPALDYHPGGRPPWRCCSPGRGHRTSSSSTARHRKTAT